MPKISTDSFVVLQRLTRFPSFSHVECPCSSMSECRLLGRMSARAIRIRLCPPRSSVKDFQVFVHPADQFGDARSAVVSRSPAKIRCRLAHIRHKDPLVPRTLLSEG